MNFSNRRNLIVLIVVLSVLIIGGIIALLLHLQNNDNNARHPAAQLTVGTQPYAYPCSVVDRELLQEALQISGEEFTLQSERFASALTQTDLSKQTDAGQPVMGTCLFALAPTSGGNTSRTFITSLDQYADAPTATNAYEDVRERAKTDYPHPALISDLPSLGGKGFLLPPHPESPDTTFRAYALHNNILITFDYAPSASDADPNGLVLKYNTGRILAQTDQVIRGITANLSDTRKATTAVSFDGIVRNGNTPLADMCSRIELQRVEDSFSIQVNNLGLTGVYSLRAQETTTAQSAERVEAIFAACSIDFRHPADSQAQDVAKNGGATLKPSEAYPHNIQVINLAFKNAEDTAKGWDSSLESMNKNGVAKTDVEGLGDKAYKTSNRDAGEAVPGSKTDSYVIQKGNRITTIITTQQALTTPYTAVTNALPEPAIKQLFEQIDATIR